LIIVDSNVLMDVLHLEHTMTSWSKSMLREHAQLDALVINDVIYAELCCGFKTRSNLDRALEAFSISLRSMTRDALHRAGRAFAEYRLRGGPRSSLLPDFFIGAHAETLGAPVLTRDTRRYSTYFPAVRLIAP
jgi:predicted nucleic acid-binding protein